MTDSRGTTRICPTRTDGGNALFAHKVTVPQCQDRQRGRFHKCYTCAFNNAYVAVHGLPAVEAEAEATGSAPSDGESSRTGGRAARGTAAAR